MTYPKFFLDLKEDFQKLPGVGEKSAERFLFSLLCLEQDEVLNFANDMVLFKNNIKKCKKCNHYTDTEICSICSDNERDKSIICVVQDSKTVFLLEKAGNYNGLYHVLGGLIDPMHGIYPEDINISNFLTNRLNEEIKEIIIALKSTIEGETTSLYLQKKLENKNLKISRLSYGLPAGTDFEYLDPISFEKALDDRKIVS